jgi:hypothetical protein
MLRNNKGYIGLDAIFSFSLFLLLTLFLLPIVMQIKIEQENVMIESKMISAIYFELMELENTSSLKFPITKEVNIQHTEANIQIIKENKLVKGCINWNNYKNEQESKCLYVYHHEKSE